MLSEVGYELQKLVAEVVLTAKRKDHRNWQIDEDEGVERRRIGSLKPSRMKPLDVFIGGGGSRATWYQERIKATHSEFGHDRVGIPPYRLTAVPKPKDLDMGPLRADEFRRFAIAYGLSIAFGEGPEIGLPSQFADAPPKPIWKPANVVDYADSKDAYD